MANSNTNATSCDRSFISRNERHNSGTRRGRHNMNVVHEVECGRPCLLLRFVHQPPHLALLLLAPLVPEPYKHFLSGSTAGCFL
jgi:hypothetical protein